MNRRQFLRISAAGVAVLSATRAGSAQGRKVINDVSRLNPVQVADEWRPRDTDELRAALRGWPGRISIGGGRFSMGGQIAADGSLHLDMRSMNRVVRYDAPQRVIRVQAGATWRDVQDTVDRDDLSVSIMQSYSNFTVGGSVSVNCHGRYVAKGPLVNSVRAVQLVTAAGDVLELTRSKEPDLFRAVFGGYGGLGVVTEVELDLDANARIERIVEPIALERYASHFREKVLPDRAMILHNADLTPPDFSTPRMISWRESDKPLTEESRLVPRGLNYTLEKNAIWAMTELPGGGLLRRGVVEPLLLAKPAVVRRNREASLDARSLEPRTRRISTYLLQEYFIPVVRFVDFATAMARILREHRVEALNVSVRHSPADPLSLLAWAKEEVFSFVLYYKQRNNETASSDVARWTRELIDAALEQEGRYYLPYRLDATKEQFARAYPEAAQFAALKARIDPGARLSNRLWEKYLPSA